MQGARIAGSSLLLAIFVLAATPRAALACTCFGGASGAFQMVAASDHVVVVTFESERKRPESRSLFDSLVQGRVRETLKGPLEVGAPIVISGQLGGGRPAYRDHGFRFDSAGCQRYSFDKSGLLSRQGYLLFLADPRPREPGLSTEPAEPVEHRYARVAGCLQPNADPISGRDDGWYRYVKRAVEAQRADPPVEPEAFFASLEHDPDWMVRLDGFLRHPELEQRAKGLVDEHPTVRFLVGRQIHGQAFYALRNGVRAFRQKHGRDPRPEEMRAVTELALVGYPLRDSEQRLVDGQLADPWGQPYVLGECGGSDEEPCDFTSIGPDGEPGTADDFSRSDVKDDRL